jgi:hypothetical protein
MTVRSDLYIALVNAGIGEDEAARLANADKPDLEGALVATLGKLAQVLRALDGLEDQAAKSLGVERTQRFAPLLGKKGDDDAR